MKAMPASIGGRLLAGSAIFTAAALLFALVLMHFVLQRFVTGQIDQRLDNKIVSLGSQLRRGPTGTISLDGEADGPPFDEPRHGSFWWVRGPINTLHTGWLSDRDFSPPDAATIEAAPAVPPPEPTAGGDPLVSIKARTLSLPGPRRATMHVRAARRMVEGLPVEILVAAPDAAIAGPMREAMTTIGLCMAGLGASLVLGSLAQIRLGLWSLTALRLQIASVRTGERTQLPLAQPDEIRPLVVELNTLLTQNAENLSRARRHVANLAHGLKTPLATLSLTVDRVEETHRPALRELITMIERRIRHHLGRARTAALDGPVRSRTALATRLRDLVDVLGHIHAEKAMRVAIACDDTVAVACEPQDVDEILGNVLENAYKFGRSRVDCDVRSNGRSVEIDIADDGPGLTGEEIDRVMRPGQRLDEGVPGYGFGLTIASEFVELYGGTLTAIPLDGGLLMRLSLPAAPLERRPGA